MLAKVEQRQVLSDTPWPEKSVNWPHDRDLSLYLFYLLHPWSFSALSEAPKLPDIVLLLTIDWFSKQAQTFAPTSSLLKNLNPGNKPIVVDIGLGDANALKTIKEKWNFITIGFGLHEISPVNAPFIDLLCYSPIARGQSAQQVFNECRGNIPLVLEAYGATTYADGVSNPMEALIFTGLLLAPGGSAKIIMSSILGEEEDQSPLGFAMHRQRLVQFFRMTLGLELIISRTYIKSMVIVGMTCIDFHVEIKRPVDAVVTEMPLNDLFARAEVEVGQCSLIPKSSNAGVFGKFNIQGRSYTRVGDEPQTTAMQVIHGIVSRSFRFAGEGDKQPVFKLHFKNQEFLSDFNARFSEYYLNGCINPKWTLSADMELLGLCLIYTGEQSNRINAMHQAKKDLDRIFPGILSETVQHARWFKPQQPAEKAPVSNIEYSPS